MPAQADPDVRDPGSHPVLDPRGLPGRVEVSWTMAGGVTAGGLLVVLATGTGMMNPGLAVYSGSVFFLFGSAVGLIHGLALGVVGRPAASTWTETASSLGLGALAVIPGSLLAWVATAFISMTPLSLSLGRPLLLVAVGAGWMVGLLVCAWAALEGCRALENAIARFALRREGNAA